MLTLFLLGDLRLERDGATLLAGRRKPLALLAFLARRGSRSASREELSALFWSGVDESNARKSLRQSLSDLRAVDGLTFVESEAGIALTRGVLSCDVDQFESYLASADWDRALAHWRGDFIPSGESLGGAEWQHWLDGQQAALRRQLAVAADHVTTAAERSGSWMAAGDAAAKWRSLLPDDSRAWCREIHALQAAGRIPEAIARVTEGERYFREQLGVDVPEDLARLSRVLGRVRHVAGTPAASLLTPDLCGRAGQMEMLGRARLAAHVGQRGRSALVIAHEGLGKTRLVREFARLTREADRNALVVEASANPADRRRPFALIHGIVAQLATRDTLAGCAPETLATLAEFAPDLRRHFRHLPSSGSGDPDAAFRAALEEVARESVLVLLVDDLADADDDSQRVLAPLLVSPPSGVLVVATGRPESWHDSASLGGIPARMDHEQQCALEPLNVEETRAALSSMAPLVPPTLDELTTTLHRASGGNPGFLAGMMTHLAVAKVLKPNDSGTWSTEPGTAASAGVPPSLKERWDARYAQFSPDIRDVADAAAVLCSATPHGAPLAVLEDVAGTAPEGFRAALDHLQLGGVLLARDSTVRFASEIIGRVAYDSFAPSRRAALHERATRRLRRDDHPVAREAVAHHRSRATRRAPGRRLAAVLAGVAALGVVAWYGVRTNGAHVRPRTTVLLADVVNLTGDSVFDQTLYLAASVGLQESRQVSLFPRSRVRETLALMRRPGADSVLDESLAREVAMRENLRRVIQVSVAHVGQRYLVAGRVIDPSSGADLFTHQETAGGREDVLVALDRVLNRVRRGVGEPADSVQAFPAPLPRVTTASLPALQSYAAAQRAFNARRYVDAYTAYHHALKLDSSFALAWLGLAELQYQAYTNRDSAYAALAQAERHKDRLTERERLRLAQTSAGYRGHLEEELRIAESLAGKFPEIQTWYNLGTMQMRRRRCPEAIASFGKSLGFDSSFVAAHINVATCHQFLGASEQAIAAYRRAWAIDSLSVYQGGLNHEFGVALVRAGLLDSAQAVYLRMSRRPLQQDRQFGYRSLGYHGAWTGNAKAAAAHFDSAALAAREAGTTLSVFRNRILQAELLETAGLRQKARESLEDAWTLRQQISLAPAFAMYAGLAFLRAGQLDRAGAMLKTIDGAMRPASADDRTVRAILAARIALAQNRLQAARRELEAATDTTRSDYLLPALVDVYVALGHRDSALVAATQFEQRAVFGIDAQDAWLRNLVIKGRIAEELGRSEVATTAYARLESQLKFGDADHLLLLETRRGLARLAVNDGRRPR